MVATFYTAWTLVILSAFVVVPRCLAAPTSQRHDDSQTAAVADDHAAPADSPPLVRTKRADEVIFNAQSGEASRVKKSDDDDAAEEQTPRAVGDDVTGGNDEKKPASDAAKTSSSSSSSSSSSAAAADNLMTENEAEGQNDDNNNGQQQDDAEPVSDDSEKVADEGADAGDDDDGDGDDDSKDSSLMLAENMEAQQQEQKLRAKRDLDADEIRELFESQNARQDDNYVPEYSYDDLDEYEYAQRPTEFDNDDVDPWQYDDFYDVEGRPKRDDDDLYQYQSDVDREAVRELLAERAAEETRQALLEYLSAGEPSYSVDEPQYVVEPIEEEEYSDLLNDDEQPDVYEEEEPEMTEKRAYPYSYEPYGGRWGALVPGAKRSDRDPYDRLYRLADLLSRPAQLGSDYEKK